MIAKQLVHLCSMFLVTLALSLGASAMVMDPDGQGGQAQGGQVQGQAQQSAQKSVQQKAPKKHKPKCKDETTDLGGNVVIDKHHIYTVITTTTKTEKVKENSIWTSGEKNVTIPQCEKRPPAEKQDECWQQDEKSGSASFKTDKILFDEPGEETTVTYCKHNEDVFVTKTTVTRQQRYKSWNDATIENEILPCNNQSKKVSKS